MQIEEGTLCPLLNTDCVQTKCSWFIKIRGTDPNNGKELDDWKCAVAWAPMLLINTADQARKTCAATENFRNEMVKQNESTGLLLQVLQKQPELLDR